MHNTEIKQSEPSESNFSELEKSIFASLENYSNVHRGSGHFSVISTSLYEEARKIILDSLELNKNYIVVFCSPLRASELVRKLPAGSYKIASSETVGLATGIRAVAVKRNKLPENLILQTGGGTTRLVSSDRITWAEAPDRLEAGTPSIINVIAFARQLQLIKRHGKITKRKEPGLSEIIFSDPGEKRGKGLLDELKKSIVGKNIPVPVTNGKADYLNLDYAATTPALKPVLNTYIKFLFAGPEARDRVSGEVKTVISETLNAPAEKYDIIFTSNTTESVNIAASGFSEMSNDRADVLLTVLEHNSNDLPWRMNINGSVLRIGIDSDGLIDIGELDRILDENKRIKLLSISAASNVLGTCNNIEEIATTTHKHGARLFVDAAQLIAHHKIDIDRCGIDFLVFSGHKVYAPFGTGVLIARKGLLNFTEEKIKEIRSSGEENTAGIAALGKSMHLLHSAGIDLIMEEEQKLLDIALTGMKRIEGIKIYGIDDPLSSKFMQRSSVIAFSLKNVWPDKLAESLAREGIGIRYGCHCAHILVKNILNVGPALQKFQFIIAALFKRMRFPGVARISFGIGITEADISRLISVLGKISHEKYVKQDQSFKKDMESYKCGVVEKVYGI